MGISGREDVERCARQYGKAIIFEINDEDEKRESTGCDFRLAKNTAKQTRTIRRAVEYLLRALFMLLSHIWETANRKPIIINKTQIQTRL